MSKEDAFKNLRPCIEYRVRCEFRKDKIIDFEGVYHYHDYYHFRFTLSHPLNIILNSLKNPFEMSFNKGDDIGVLREGILSCDRLTPLSELEKLVLLKNQVFT